MNVATWINGKQTVKGRWEYIWQSDRFVIILDKKDRITGDNRKIVVAGDRPEWGNWVLQKEVRDDGSERGSTSGTEIVR